MTKTEGEKVKEQIENSIMTKFTVTAPIKWFNEEFKPFCKKHTNDTYWLAIKMGIDALKADAKYKMLFDEIQKQNQRIEMLEKSPKEEEQELPRTFGRGGNDE